VTPAVLSQLVLRHLPKLQVILILWMLLENDGLPINKKLLNAYEEIITLVCGNDLNQESEKSKEKELNARLFIKMKAYVLLRKWQTM
jgi:hypothetical protein